MTPEELRADIPAIEETTYLNTGASGPSPHRVIDAVEDCLEGHEASHAGEGPYPYAWDQFDRTHERVADFIGADPSEVALTESTCDGINRVASALDWEEGDAVVRTDLEHSAGILPWDRLRDRRGVEVRVVGSDRGRLDMDDVKEAVDGAKLLFFSAIDWGHGTTLPTRELAEIAHDAGARVLVDAVQVPGQTPMDVHDWGVDYIAAAGHKWLLGPWGTGFVYAAEEAVDDLQPLQLGYRSVEEANADPYELDAGASRLELGTTNPAPYAGLREVMDTIESIGFETVESRIETLTDRLKEGLDDDAILSPDACESGLVSFTVDDPEATVERLAEENVVIRSLPMPGVVRASLHVFNTEEDVDRLLDVL